MTIRTISIYKPTRYSAQTLAIAIAIAALAVAPLGAASPDADVPDLETRIRNTGNSIPAAAIPPVPAPAPAPFSSLPATEPPAVVPVPALPSAPAEPAATAVSAPEPAIAPSVNGESPVSGSVRLGAGSPGTLIGDLSVRREEGTLPSLSLDFTYASADGYGPERSGTGFFDRAARASFGAGKAGSGASAWFALVDLSDVTNGMQGKNPRYYGLTRRDVDWSLGLRSVPLGSSAFSLSALADGSVNSAFAEGPPAGLDGSTAATAGTAAIDGASAIDDFAGYRLSPSVELAFMNGDFRAALSGRYAYETALDFGETHAISGDLSLSYGIGGMKALASCGVAGDGGSGAAGDGIVIPFSLGFVWKPEEAAGGTSGDATSGDAAATLFIEEARLSLGIARERQSSVTLADSEPLVETSGLSSYSADWIGSGGFALGMRMNGDSELSARFGAEYRKSLPGHGMLALTDTLTLSSLVAARRVERDSFVATAGAGLSAAWFALDARYSGEWLDRLDRLSVHTATVGASVFDRGPDRVWEAGVRSSFALDHAEYPTLSANGTVRPFRNFSVTLSLLDILPLVAGDSRARNGLFAVRSGELTLSAKMYF